MDILGVICIAVAIVVAVTGEWMYEKCSEPDMKAAIKLGIMVICAFLFVIGAILVDSSAYTRGVNDSQGKALTSLPIGMEYWALDTFALPNGEAYLMLSATSSGSHITFYKTDVANVSEVKNGTRVSIVNSEGGLRLQAYT